MSQLFAANLGPEDGWSAAIPIIQLFAGNLEITRAIGVWDRVFATLSADSGLRLRAGHSITLSARRRIDCGILMPSAFAVFMLITSSNLVGCSTGRSPG